MIHTLFSIENPFKTMTPKSLKPSLSLNPLKPPVLCTHRQNPNIINKKQGKSKTHVVKPNLKAASTGFWVKKGEKIDGFEEKRGFFEVGGEKIAVLCGFGYWVQGFRCFPWLAMNFHMAQNLGLQPSVLQVVQNSGNLPMVAKPLYGILSDVMYISGAHRIPYISIGVLFQILAWCPLALIPAARETLPFLIACVLLSNLGASITEVAKDALVAEYGQKWRFSGLQSYALMASAAGGILGNLLSGYFLLKTLPNVTFLVFAALLSLELIVSLSSKEQSLGLPLGKDEIFGKESVLGIIKNQFLNLLEVIQEDSITRPLVWIVSSIATVPLLSGSVFCYQTRCLNLDPSVIGMSKVIGQLTLLLLTVLYDRCWQKVPTRKLICGVQILYVSSLFLDFVLVKQINVGLGIPNEAFVLCFSSLAETLAQFKILPFNVLLASMCPHGCEGSLVSFLGSVLCLSSIVSGFLGIGLASVIGISSGDCTNLAKGILVQIVAALVPLVWIHNVPMFEQFVEREPKRGMSKKSRRNRRVGRVSNRVVYAYRRKREPE